MNNRIPHPPLSTGSLPLYREWTSEQYREHLTRIKDLAEEGLAVLDRGEEIEMSLFDDIASCADHPTY